MLETVLPILGGVFVVLALAFIFVLSLVVFGSFAYGCVMSCIMAIRHLTHGHGPAPTRS